MLINMYGFRGSTPARALPGKGKARIAFTGALATINAFARACAQSWAYAHRTRRVMGFSDEGGASQVAPSGGQIAGPAHQGKTFSKRNVEARP